MKEKKAYEPPMMKIYPFDDENILTESGGVNPSPAPTANYAANALNDLFGGTNTTIEK